VLYTVDQNKPTKMDAKTTYMMECKVMRSIIG
jgi:hypothetical protein